MDSVLYLDAGGVQRRYVAHLPPDFAPDRPRAAVMMLDGRGGTPWTAMRSTSWSACADAHDFVLLYPEALRLTPGAPMHFLSNPQMWNAGPGGADTERDGVDDVAFLKAVFEDARQRFRLDPVRYFAAGFSNGAAMAYRLAVEAPELLAAFAPVAGHLRRPPAQLSRAIPMTGFFGALDPLSPLNGGPVDLPWGAREERPAALLSPIAWARLCGLGDEPAVEVRSGVTVRTWGPSTSGVEVRFTVIDDCGHTWPGGHRLLPETIAGATTAKVNATAEAWAFFCRCIGMPPGKVPIVGTIF